MKLQPEHIVIFILLAIVVLDMVLLAVYVLFEHHDLNHINAHKQGILFILGGIFGWLGRQYVDHNKP